MSTELIIRVDSSAVKYQLEYVYVIHIIISIVPSLYEGSNRFFFASRANAPSVSVKTSSRLSRGLFEVEGETMLS